jgi:hypothetical protein
MLKTTSKNAFPARSPSHTSHGLAVPIPSASFFTQSRSFTLSSLSQIMYSNQAPTRSGMISAPSSSSQRTRR